MEPEPTSTNEQLDENTQEPEVVLTINQQREKLLQDHIDIWLSVVDESGLSESEKIAVRDAVLRAQQGMAAAFRGYDYREGIDQFVRTAILGLANVLLKDQLKDDYETTPAKVLFDDLREGIWQYRVEAKEL